MASVTMEQIHEDLIGIKRELQHLRDIVEENFDLADDVISDIKESRKKLTSQMISHEEMRKEFGV